MSSFDPALTEWEVELESRVRRNEARIVREKGRLHYRRLLEAAIRADDQKTAAYRTFGERISRIPDTPSPKEYLLAAHEAMQEAVEAAPEEVRPLVQDRIGEELGMVLEAGKIFGQARQTFGRRHGDPDSALAEYRARPESIQEPLRTTLQSLSSFPAFWREIEAQLEPGAPIRKIARNTTLLDAMGVTDEFPVSADLDLGVGPEDRADYLLEKAIREASISDRRTLEENRDIFSKIARARSVWLEMAGGADEHAKEIAREDRIPYQEARMGLQGALLEARRNLQEMKRESPKLSRDPFFLPVVPRVGPPGRFRPLVEQLIRGGEHLTRGIRGSVISPEREREIRGFVGAVAPASQAPGALNFQTILDEATVIGLLGPQFAASEGIVGRGLAAVIHRIGGGKVLQSAARGFGAGAAGEALTPQEEIGDVRGRLTRAGLGGTGGLVAGAAAPLIGKGLRRIGGKAGTEAAQETAEAASAAAASRETAPVQDRVLKAVEALEPLRGERAKLVRQARARAATRFGEARKGAETLEELGKARRALAGSADVPEFEPLQVMVEDIDEMARIINTSPKLREFEVARASQALEKLFHPDGTVIPQPAELELLGRVFGEEFVQKVAAKRGDLSKMMRLAAEVVGLPRAFLSTADVSAVFRQGLLTSVRHPIKALRNIGQMFRYMASPATFEKAMDEIVARPTYEKMVSSHLALTGIRGRVKITGREEAFMSRLGEKIPGFGAIMRASNRAHTGFLTRMRADVFDDILARAERMNLKAAKKGKPQIDLDDKSNLTALAEYINAASGRGSLGRFEESAPLLAQAFFSPRLITSRLQMLNYLNPVKYVTGTPAQRLAQREALRSMMATLGAGMTVLAIAKAGGAQVGDDWTSSDFGKIKIGRTRIDIWGGFQQYIVLIARILKGAYTSSVTGERRPLGQGFKETSPAELVGRFALSKRNPFARIAADTINILGTRELTDPLSGKPLEKARWIEDNFVPIIVQDVLDLMEEDPDLVPLSVLSAFGVGVQTYPLESEGRSRIVNPAMESVAP